MARLPRLPRLAAPLLLVPSLAAQHLLVVEENFESVLLVSRIDGEVLDPVLVNMHLSTGSSPVRPVQAIDVGDEIWIPDAEADVIFRFNDQGDYLGEFGAGRNELGGLARVGGRVWVANTGAGFGKALKEYDTLGNLLAVHDVAGTSDPLSITPYKGLLLVSDDAGHDLDLYDLDGNFVSTFHDSEGLVGIDEPRQAFVRNNGNVLVGGSGSLSGIYEYDPSGKQVAYYDTAAQGYPDVRGVHELLNGNFLFTSTSGIHVFDTKKGTIHTNFGGVVAGYISRRAPFQSERVVTELIDDAGDGQNDLITPGRIHVSPDGTLHISGESSHYVFRVTPGGAIDKVFNVFFGSPTSVAVDAAGNLFASSGFDDSVYRRAPDGTESTIIDETGDGVHQLSMADFVHVDQAGNVYVAGTFSDNVFKITPAGVITQILDQTGDGQGNNVYFPGPILTDDTTGDVYVVDTGEVFRIEPGGTVTTIYDDPFFSADEIALHPATGQVYASDTWGDRVGRVLPDRSVEILMNQSGDGAGNALVQPRGITVGADGTVWVVARGSNEVARLFERRPDGTVNVIWSGTDELGNSCEDPQCLLRDAAGSLYVVGEGSHNAFRVGAPLTLGTNYCDPAVINSSGMAALVTAVGSDTAAENELALRARFLPPSQPGYFLTSQTQAFVAQPGGSQGNLCLGGLLGRFSDKVQSSGSTGSLAIDVDLTKMPPGNQVVLPGQTWSFQAWYRDKNPGTTSNFTNGVAVSFL